MPAHPPSNHLDDYKNRFVQRHPRYAVKRKGGRWRTRKQPLSDKAIQAHLDKQYSIASLGRWYPEYAAFDFDDFELKDIERTRAGLGLDDSNSMLMTSESADSYHLYFRPAYNDKPPTLNLLQTILKPYAKQNGCEIYPQKRRCFRLPFGKNQDCIDFEYAHLDKWQDKLFWAEKLDDFDLSSVQLHQRPIDFKAMQRESGLILPATESGITAGNTFFDQGRDLLEYGLQAPGTRHDSQFKVIYHLWRNNIDQDTAYRMTWAWICKKHNGYSKTILQHPHRVKYEITAQVSHVYTHYDFRFILPDTAHNTHKGFICKDDIQDIVHLGGGNIPRSKFLFQLVRYMNPRRHRNNVRIHRDKLVRWSNERTYLLHLLRLKLGCEGLFTRSTGYVPGKYSKSIKLKWNYRNESNAVLYQGRAVDTLDKAVAMLYTPADFRSMLRGAGAKKGTAWASTKALFDKAEKV